MNSQSIQNKILEAQNREEIIKLSKYHQYLPKIENHLIERKLKDINEIAQNAARVNKSKLDTQFKVEAQRKVLQKLFIETKKALKKKAAETSNVDTATRLVEKLNYMRRLTLILLSSTDTIATEFVLAVSRDLIGSRSLEHYMRRPEMKDGKDVAC